MAHYIIGIDPDSKKHGVAVYKDGVLDDLLMNDLMNLMDTIVTIQGQVDFDSSVIVHMENVCGVSNSGFHHKRTDSVAVKAKKSENVGQCKQAQIEVERLCEYLSIKVVKHKISKQWKDPTTGKPMFERLTGWTGRSNEDSRSAAYFGYLGVTQ